MAFASSPEFVVVLAAQYDHQQLGSVSAPSSLEASNQCPNRTFMCGVAAPSRRTSILKRSCLRQSPKCLRLYLRALRHPSKRDTHGEVRERDQIAGRALVFTGGATYVGSDYNNSFRSSPPRKFLGLQGFVFDLARGTGRPPARPASSLGSPVAAPAWAHCTCSIEDWPFESPGDARRVRDSKSRAASPNGNSNCSSNAASRSQG